MKYILSIFGMILICCGVFFCRVDSDINLNNEYIRIHITANSSSTVDQNVKYTVKDAVIEYLGKELENVPSKEEAMSLVSERIFEIQTLVDMVLDASNVNYKSKISIVQEDVPVRAYDDLVLEAGVYDCLNIELGQAKGDAWWCVVFPSVCSVPTKNYQDLEYISKIWEMINSVKS